MFYRPLGDTFTGGAGGMVARMDTRDPHDRDATASWELNPSGRHDPLCDVSEGRWDGGCTCEWLARVRADQDAAWAGILEANRLALLEHTAVILSSTHAVGTCMGSTCTLHNRSEHHMRSWPQAWRADRGSMERICPHGVGHPDPDDPASQHQHESVHGCDSCCHG